MSVCVHGGGEGRRRAWRGGGKEAEAGKRETERDRVITESSREAREAMNVMAWTVEATS
jgi:hypothetical protein